MRFPKIIPNQDGSGVIASVGEGVPASRGGGRVWLYESNFGSAYGAAAEYTVQPAQPAVPLPENASFADGACLGVPAMTAHRAEFADRRAVELRDPKIIEVVLRIDAMRPGRAVANEPLDGAGDDSPASDRDELLLVIEMPYFDGHLGVRLAQELVDAILYWQFIRRFTFDFEHDINVAYALMAGTEKPLCLSFRSRDFIAPAIEMFDLALGGEGRFVKQPFCIFGGCPIVSPLKFGQDNLEVLIETSRLGLVSDIAVAPQSGATAPAPLAGIVVQVIAETLACLAVVNLIRPGCPMTFAAWPFITDLRTGSFSGGGGEQALLAAAAVQMGKFYNLPNSVGAGMTDSKIPDAQSGFEKG